MTTPDKRNKILERCNSLKPEYLVDYITKGDVTFKELIDAGLKQEKIDSVKTMMADKENQLWNSVINQKTPKVYKEYLSMFPDGVHSKQALQELNELDNLSWNNVMSSPTADGLKDYKQLFPNGAHIKECNDLLNDLPWLEAINKNSVEAYRSYMNMYPYKHDREAKEAINKLEDDEDWNEAVNKNSSAAYRSYKTKHPNGKHYDEANKYIAANKSCDDFLDALKKSPNSYRAEDIKNIAGNKQEYWDGITNLFGEDVCNAIKKFTRADQKLPINRLPDQLLGGCTEVYFWGMPSSGKTCALAAILSHLRKMGKSRSLECSGKHYTVRLSNVFDSDTNNGVCVLPEQTSSECIEEMVMNLYDKNEKAHKITLVDLAGELFETAYDYEKGIVISDQRKKSTLETAMKYLKDQRNKKIHFFVIEYNGHDKIYNDEKRGKLKVVDFLDNMSDFLERNKIFSRSTVGAYILVTKCDNMLCEKGERENEAKKYVKDKLLYFWNNLNRICKSKNINDVKILPFSIGTVIANDVCKFDVSDSQKIIDKLLLKTPAFGDSFWDKLIKFFNS